MRKITIKVVDNQTEPLDKNIIEFHKIIQICDNKTMMYTNFISTSCVKNKAQQNTFITNTLKTAKALNLEQINLVINSMDIHNNITTLVNTAIDL